MERGELDIADVAADYVNCTQCGACELRCPNTLFTGDFYRFRTRTVDVVKAVRALAVESGVHQPGLAVLERAHRPADPRAGARRDPGRAGDGPELGRRPRPPDRRRDGPVRRLRGGVLPDVGAAGGRPDAAGRRVRVRPDGRPVVLRRPGRGDGLRRAGAALRPAQPGRLAGHRHPPRARARPARLHQLHRGLPEVLRRGVRHRGRPRPRRARRTAAGRSAHAVGAGRPGGDLSRPLPAQQAQGHLGGAPGDPARDPRADLPRRRPGDPVVLLLGRRRRPADREAGAHREDQRAAAGAGRGARRGHAGQRLPVVGATPRRGRRRPGHRRRRPARTPGPVAGHRRRRLPRRRRGRRPGPGTHGGAGAGPPDARDLRRRGQRLRECRRLRLRGALDDRHCSRRARHPAAGRRAAGHAGHRAARRAGRGADPHREDRPLQPGPGAGPLPGAPLVGARARRRRPPDLHRAGGGGGPDRQRPAGARRPAGRRHRPDRRRRPAAPRHRRRRQADEPDPRTGPGQPDGHRRHRHQHAQAQRAARPARAVLSRRPGVLPLLARRRADRHERLVADRLALRAHPRPGAELRPRAADRGRAARRGRHRRQDQQELERLPAQAPLHGPPGHARASRPGPPSSCSRSPRPSSPRSGRSTTTTTPTPAWARWPAPGSPPSPAPCCSTSTRSPTCAGTTRPTSPSRPTSARWSARSCTATRTRSASAGKRLFRIAKEHGARYLGDEISEGDWAARHDRYATPLHGRTKDGQVVPMSWHCEDAAIPYSNVPAVTQGLARDRRRPAAQDRRLRRLGHVRLHLGEHRRGLPDRDRRRHLGAAARRRGVGGVGGREEADRRGRRWPTAARSAPATGPAGRGRSTSCRRSWAGAST